MKSIKLDCGCVILPGGGYIACIYETAKTIQERQKHEIAWDDYIFGNMKQIKKAG